MNVAYLSDPAQTQDGWEVSFAFQAFHRLPDEWAKMRWGFNAGALLDEALDRLKLFIESQSVNEDVLFEGDEPRRTLVLRGTNFPGAGLQMTLLGKVNSPNPARTTAEARIYAREISSIFPHDFILRPAESIETYKLLLGTEFFAGNPGVALVQRADVIIPAVRGGRLVSFWQSSVRANEQIWRALSAMRQTTIFSIVIQPSFLHDGEKKFLSELKKKLHTLDKESSVPPALVLWADNCIKRRLAVWKKYFLLQVHVLTDGEIDDSLLRSIGSALTRDTNDMPLPGFRVLRPNSMEEEKEWRKRINALDFVPSSALVDDLADADEVFSVFRFLYRHEAGLPGADFIDA